MAVLYIADLCMSNSLNAGDGESMVASTNTRSMAEPIKWAGSQSKWRLQQRVTSVWRGVVNSQNRPRADPFTE